MKERIFVFGAGGHAGVVIDAIEQQGRYEVAGLIDSKKRINSTLNNYSVIGRQEEIVQLCERYNVNKGIVCIGDNFLRGRLAGYILEMLPNFKFINVIHPTSVIAKHVEMGNGNVILSGVVINNGAAIGNHCILNTKSVLEHDSVMNDFSSLSVGVLTGGYSFIDEFVAVSIGATIFDRVRIGKHSVIGAGAVVNKDIPPKVIAYGIPARIIRNREEGEKYLN